MRKEIIALTGALGLALAACSPATDATDAAKLHITTSFYPLTYLVEEIAGDTVAITDLTPPGGSAHGVELSPSDIAKMQQSDLVIYAAKVAPAIDDAVAAANLKSLNVAEYAELLPYPELAARTAPGGINDDFLNREDEATADDDHSEHDDDQDDDHASHPEEHNHDHGTHDPHFWTDPDRMAQIAPVIAKELSKLNPEQEDAYTTRAQELKTQLEDLADKYETAFEATTCRTNAFIVSHEAFGYLADGFNLVQIGVAGIDPEIEPSPARVKEIADLAKQYQVDTIFATSDAELRTVESIAEGSGLKAAVLDPVASQRDPNKDYMAVVEENFKRLLAANGC
ncbi:MAG: metal ABC transporter substrate-binding protein [Trueperella sp.]|nr:metal ABC transporter substrate-binding protein [Trueperella sp.]